MLAELLNKPFILLFVNMCLFLMAQPYFSGEQNFVSRSIIQGQKQCSWRHEAQTPNVHLLMLIRPPV